MKRRIVKVHENDARFIESRYHQLGDDFPQMPRMPISFSNKTVISIMSFGLERFSQSVEAGNGASARTGDPCRCDGVEK